MATKEYCFTGTCKWAMLNKPDDKFGKYQINVYLTPESWELFKESGIRVQPKSDPDGDYVKFSCPPSYIMMGRKVDVPEIPVVDMEGKQVLDLIGNGSTISCLVEVYDTRLGKGHRLTKVRVEHLVPYVKQEGEPAYQRPKSPF
jgi:hypothetical protein